MPSSDGKRGNRFRDHRTIVEGIVYRFRTGIAWRDLPERFGPWQTVWKRHRRFSEDGTWDRIHTAQLTRPTRLLEPADHAVGRSRGGLSTKIHHPELPHVPGRAVGRLPAVLVNRARGRPTAHMGDLRGRTHATR